MPSSKPINLSGRDFISDLDFSVAETEAVLDLAAKLKQEYRSGIPHPLLRDKALAMLFFFTSTRTRGSFEAGMAQLGGHGAFIDSQTTQISHGDTAKEIGRIFGSYFSGIAIRQCDWNFGNRYINEVAEHSPVPVLNMQCDVYHPFQILADLLTIREAKGRNLKRKKIAVSWAYAASYQKPISVPQSLIIQMARFGMDVVLAHPPEYKLMPEILDKASAGAAAGGGSFRITHDMDDAFQDADVVYPKSWGCMLTTSDLKESAEIGKKYTAWICDERRMSLAKPDAIYMHCLPADRGLEVADAVIDGPQSIVYEEAENRLHVQKAVMVMTMGSQAKPRASARRGPTRPRPRRWQPRRSRPRSSQPREQGADTNKTNKGAQPPGPSGDFLGLHVLAQLRDDPLKLFLGLARTYGDIVHFGLGPIPAYLVSHPDYVHTLLVEDADKVYKMRTLKRVLEPALGQGLLINDGESVRRQRRLVQPAFHSKRIEAYGGVMVDFAQRMLAEWQASDGIRAVNNDMMKLTLGIVAKTLFDADVSDKADRIGDAITSELEVINAQFGQPFPLPRWLPTRNNRREKQALKLLNEIIMGFIRDRRGSGEDKGDLLSMLLMAIDSEGSGNMTDKQARDEAITLFAAGHETTSNALTWTWYLLSQHQQVEARLHTELDSVLAGRAPMMADLPNLPFTDWVIKESMRLYPPAWTVGRETIAPIQLGDYSIPAGRVVFATPWVSHRDARFFSDPEQFIPERWAGQFEKNLPKGAYFPFGAGPRICIGNIFALMEARLVLATLAQHFSLKLVPGQVIATQPMITLRPRYGMMMQPVARV